MSGNGWRTFDHTGDLGLEVWAADPAGLFAEAAIALMAQIAEVKGTASEAPVAATLHLRGDDPGDLFVHWLNSVLLEAEVRHAIWTSAEVRLEGFQLEARVAGPRRDPTSQTFLREVKAVSHHHLALDLTPGGCRARLVLDL